MNYQSVPANLMKTLDERVKKDDYLSLKILGMGTIPEERHDQPESLPHATLNHNQV